MSADKCTQGILGFSYQWTISFFFFWYTVNYKLVNSLRSLFLLLDFWTHDFTIYLFLVLLLCLAPMVSDNNFINLYKEILKVLYTYGLTCHILSELNIWIPWIDSTTVSTKIGKESHPTTDQQSPKVKPPSILSTSIKNILHVRRS